MVLLTLSIFLTGLLYTHANVWQLVHDPTPHNTNDDVCYEGFFTCARQVNSTPTFPTEDNSGITFSRENVNSFCSTVKQVIPCIAPNKVDLEICNDANAVLDQILDFYDFVCMANKNDMYNLVDCANNKMVQIDVTGHIRQVTGGAIMLGQISETSIVIPFNDKVRLMCLVMNDFKQRTLATIKSRCGEENEDTIRILMTMPRITLNLFMEIYIDSIVATCLEPGH